MFFVLNLCVVNCIGFFVGFGFRLLGFALTLVTKIGSVVNCHCGFDPDLIELCDVMKPGSVVDCHPCFVYAPICILFAPERASVLIGLMLCGLETATVCAGGDVTWIFVEE